MYFAAKNKRTKSGDSNAHVRLLRGMSGNSSSSQLAIRTVLVSHSSLLSAQLEGTPSALGTAYARADGSPGRPEGGSAGSAQLPVASVRLGPQSDRSRLSPLTAYGRVKAAPQGPRKPVQPRWRVTWYAQKRSRATSDSAIRTQGRSLEKPRHTRASRYSCLDRT